MYTHLSIYLKAFATLDLYFTMLSYLRIGLYIRNDL